ncbi:tRNA (adenosine(37)-N6)-threonylcarbamoyltransferase complex ATPase subunit type 1 TsaE [Arcanobacterium hippocoleae]|uniref:tRNA (adenosine(37)-N6)-threonylcarbamoyltransferase complex ATPase subunit type 1 TsaE n=1 Tax=Arcanobacterium hippocoleae TaxID=149017 RepID=UPI00333EFD9A
MKTISEKNGWKFMTAKIEVLTVEQIQAVGAAFGRHAQGGDLLMLNGPLGAGKTTMTQGIAQGIGVNAKISSPTFVIAQNYAGAAGVDLVHVDAYRLDSLAELDALDLDSSLDAALTVVEWGAGKVEVLSADRIELTIKRPQGAAAGLEPADLDADAPRTLLAVAYGERGNSIWKLYLQILMWQH